MRLYETVFILKPDLSEEENQSWIQRIIQVIEQNKGELIRTDEWGTTPLAYKIRKFNKGYYVYAVFMASDTCVRELDRHFKMLDPFLRHIIVKLDERELEKHKQAQLAKEVVVRETPPAQEVFEALETPVTNEFPESEPQQPTEEVPA